MSAMLCTPTLVAAPSAAFPEEPAATSDPASERRPTGPPLPSPVPAPPSKALPNGSTPSPPPAAGELRAPSPVAQGSPLPPGSTQQTPLNSEAAYRAAYAQAREQLLRGEFTQAAPAFEQLARTAPTLVDRALAFEMAQLAHAWAQRDLAFVRRSDLGESSLSDKAVNRRTTDEMAVLYTNAVFYGIGTGVWLGVHTEPDSPAGFILPSLLFGGAAVGAIAFADHRNPLGYGVPQSIVSGLYIGLEEGLVWTLWNQARVTSSDEWSEATLANVIWGFSTAGAIAGGVVGSIGGTTPGRASWVGSTALWSGLVVGMGVAALSPDDEMQDDRALLAGAIGLNAGAVLGALAAGPVSPSIARVRFLDLGGIGGALLLGGLYVAIEEDDPEPRAGAAALSVGMAGGLAIAWFATRGLPRDDTVRSAPSPKSPSALPSWRATLLPVAGGAALGASGEF